jgi:hypothetical protein
MTKSEAKADSTIAQRSSRSDSRSLHADVMDGAAAFTTTHWSVVLAAQGGLPAASEALEKLCRTYWRPL